MEKDEKKEKTPSEETVNNTEKKESVKEKMNEIKEKVKLKDTKKKVKPLVSSRVLFITILDKIFLIMFALLLIVITYNSFAGNLSSANYGYFARILRYCFSLVGLAIYYFFMNWLYGCLAKTMMCITDKEIYIEKYVPFVRHEITMPLEKVTKVTAIDILWIFRVVIVHQYMQLPVVFWTWTNHEFKDCFDKLTVKREDKVENEFDAKSIIPKSWNSKLIIVAIVLVAIILLVGIGRGFGLMFSPSKKVPGTYVNENDKQIVLEKDGKCDITEVESKSKKCTWEYDDESESVKISYEYEMTSYYYGTKTYSNYKSFKYNADEKTLEDSYNKFKRQ